MIGLDQENQELMWFWVNRIRPRFALEDDMNYVCGNSFILCIYDLVRMDIKDLD